ncbi:hypothetical protein MTR_7g032680 [Medicago truncatula]|uniref:Uncharacterized protein n=1 Tax=Medicago truncatula TaxID=3880 RepID=G7L5F3_MEDTR|nr:hypothetical protein MTR_7g032680 [Medicago truncatula]
MHLHSSATYDIDDKAQSMGWLNGFFAMEQIFERLSLRAKERRFGADLCQKYEDLIQKYLVQKV